MLVLIVSHKFSHVTLMREFLSNWNISSLDMKPSWFRSNTEKQTAKEQRFKGSRHAPKN